MLHRIKTQNVHDHIAFRDCIIILHDIYNENHNIMPIPSARTLIFLLIFDFNIIRLKVQTPKIFKTLQIFIFMQIFDNIIILWPNIFYENQ